MSPALDKGLAAVADRSLAAEIEYLAQEAFLAGHRTCKNIDAPIYDSFTDFWDQARANPHHAAVFAIKDETGLKAVREGDRVEAIAYRMKTKNVFSYSNYEVYKTIAADLIQADPATTQLAALQVDLEEARLNDLHRISTINALQAECARYRDALTAIEGGHTETGITTDLVLSGQWQSIATLYQGHARQALAAQTVEVK